MKKLLAIILLFSITLVATANDKHKRNPLNKNKKGFKVENRKGFDYRNHYEKEWKRKHKAIRLDKGKRCANYS